MAEPEKAPTPVVARESALEVEDEFHRTENNLEEHESGAQCSDGTGCSEEQPCRRQTVTREQSNVEEYRSQEHYSTVQYSSGHYGTVYHAMEDSQEQPLALALTKDAEMEEKLHLTAERRERERTEVEEVQNGEHGLKKEAGEVEEVDMKHGEKEVKVEVGVEGGHGLGQVDMETVAPGMGEHVVEVTTDEPEYMDGVVGSYVAWEGETTVQVQYLGPADISRLTTDATIEYVTLPGDISNQEVIGVLRDPSLEYEEFTSLPSNHTSSDPLQAAINSVGEIGGREEPYLLGNLGDGIGERELPPPPPPFDDPAPGSSIDHYDREYTTLTTLDTVSMCSYPSLSSLRSSPPPRYPGLPAYSLSSPSYYYSPPSAQTPSYRGYSSSLLQPTNLTSDLPWPHYDPFPTSQHSQHSLPNDAIPDVFSPGLGRYGHYVPSAANSGYHLHQTESGSSDTGSLTPRYSALSQDPPSSDPFSPATGGECVTCGAALGGRVWRRDGGVACTQLCDSCANYSKMNGIRPSGGSSGSRSPPARPKVTSTGTGNRRTGMECANCFTNTTTLWRRNNQGNPVCNACGLYFKLHGINRPPSKKNDGIRSRKRKPKTQNTTKEPRKQSKSKAASTNNNNGNSSRIADQPVNYRIETRNEGGSVKMELLLNPELEQEMILSNIKQNQQIMMSQLKSPDELQYPNLSSLDPMMARSQDSTYTYLRCGVSHASGSPQGPYSPSPLIHSSQASASPLLSQTSSQSHSPHPIQTSPLNI